jgi:squalene-hopene/tetraprenyl-beta-curcumene cyclase
MHWADEVDAVLQEKCAGHIRRRQSGDGGWPIYNGGPSEINASVKAYFALKLAGARADAPHMRDARATILRLGGIPRMNTYGKLYLAMLGQFPWQHLPVIPAELVLLPRWLPLSLGEMSSWSRAMLVPLAIINHFKPTRTLPAEWQLHELYPAGTEQDDLSLHRQGRAFSWRNYFLLLSRLARVFDWRLLAPLRRRALCAAEKWMLERSGPGSDGLAAVFPAMLNSIIALKTLGYPPDHPVLRKALTDLEGLYVDDPEDFRIQPCLSPVWDTAINLIALVESGLPCGDAASARAMRWLAAREVRHRGDWAVKNPHPEASGWAFEFNNAFYPDTDDTMMVLMALRFFAVPDPAQFERALRWLLSFQCKDGGWAAFDKDVTRRWLEDMPFADHNAILDPTCSDLTGRMLELLGYIGHERDAQCVRRAIAFLRRTQEADGSWYGRWGVNYIYGTWQVLRGLHAIGEDMRQPWIVRARDWLLSCQNDDGGWGEGCVSYDDPSLKGREKSTPSQTAWALMGLCAADVPDGAAVARGIDFLLRTQNADGSWSEPQTTGTGFPRVFYLKYDMYRNNWPLLALATYANCRPGLSRPGGRFRLPRQ